MNGVGFSSSWRALIALIAAVSLGSIGIVAVAAPAGAAGVSYVSTVLADPSDSTGDVSLHGISCPQVNFCVAVGYHDATNPDKSSQYTLINVPYVETWSNGTWTPQTLPSPASTLYARLQAVSCASTTACVAFGSVQSLSGGIGAGTENPFVETLSGTTWSVTNLSNPTYYTYAGGVSCASATSCVAVASSSGGNVGDGRGVSYTLANGSWTEAPTAQPSTGSQSVSLSAVSCTAATACEAVGSTNANGVSTPLVETLSGTTWTASRPGAPAVATGGAELTGVSCTSAGLAGCYASGIGTVGTDPNTSYDTGIVEKTDGSGGTELNPDTVNDSADADAVSCVDATDCTVTGNYYGTAQLPLVYALSGTTWSQTTAAAPSGTHDSDRYDGVSCVLTTATCVAAGSVDGETHALVGTNEGATPPTLTATAFSVSAASTATAGTAFNVTITAQTTAGTTDATYTGAKTVTFSGPASSPGGTAPSYPASVTFANGVGTASVTLTDAQSTTITATQGSLTGTSGTVAVTPAAASSFGVSVGGAFTAGTAGTVSVKALDTYGNTATGYAGAQSLTFSGPGTSPTGSAPSYPASVTFASGAASPPVTLYDAQSVSLAVAASGISSGSAAVTVNPATPATVTVGALPSIATAGTAHAFTVAVTDTYGNTATQDSKTLSFSSSDAAATLPSGAKLAAGAYSGSVTFKTAGSQTLTASDGTVSGKSSSVVVSAASASQLGVGFPAAVTAGSPATLTLTALDAYGNTDTTVTGPRALTVTGPGTSPNGTAPTIPATVTFAAGVATASVTLTKAESPTLTVGAGGYSGQASTAVAPGAAASLTVSGLPATATAGSGQPFAVDALDAEGNEATDDANALTLGSSDTKATLPSGVALTAGHYAGSVTFHTAGSQTVSAGDGSLSGTSSAVSVSGAPATHFTVGFPGEVAAGDAHTVTLTALDGDGNIDTAYSGAHAVSVTGPAVSPNGTAPTLPATATFTAGVATASVTLTAAQSTALTVTAAALSGVSGTVVVDPASAAALTVTGLPATATAGASLPFTVDAFDSYGNAATADQDAVTFTSSDPQAVLPTGVSLADGTATGNVDYRTAGAQTVTATDPANSAVTGESSATVVAAGVVSSFTVTGPSTATAGTALPLTITAKDAFGNVATSYSGSQALTFSGPGTAPDGATPSYPASVDFTDGVAMPSVTLPDAQQVALGVAQGAVQGTTPTFTVTPASLATLTVASSAPSTTAGTTTSYTSTGFDAFGNRIGDETASTTFSTTGGGVCTGASCRVTTSTPSGQPDTVTGTDGPVSGTTTLVVTPAALDHIVVTTGAVGTNGAPVPVTVTGYDVYGNVIGDVTRQSALSISPDGTCAATTCTPANGGPHTISASIKTPGGTMIAATGSASAIAGYRAPSFNQVLLHTGDGSSTVTYRVNSFGALPVSISLTAVAKGHPSHTARGSSPSGQITVRNLLDGVKYTFTLTASTVQGSANVTTAGAGVPARVPMLTLKLSHRSQVAGATLVLTGRILNGKTPVTGRRVTLVGTIGRLTVTLGSTRTDRNGTFRFTEHPAATTSYVATAIFGEAASPTVSRNKAVSEHVA